MGKESVYFENNKMIVESKNKKKTYPVNELRYKETCMYYKRISKLSPIDGSECTKFLEFYYNGRKVGIITFEQYNFDELINKYNLKIYRENEKNDPTDYFVHLKKPGNLIFAHAMVFWSILMLLFVYFVGVIFETGIKFYLNIVLIFVIAILDIYIYRKNNYKIYYDNEKIELRYTFKKKTYTFEQISDYKIYESVMNNKIEMINISLDEKTSILINQEYENYNHFKKILIEKAFSSYMC